MCVCDAAARQAHLWRRRRHSCDHITEHCCERSVRKEEAAAVADGTQIIDNDAQAVIIDAKQAAGKVHSRGKGRPVCTDSGTPRCGGWKGQLLKCSGSFVARWAWQCI